MTDDCGLFDLPTVIYGTFYGVVRRVVFVSNEPERGISDSVLYLDVFITKLIRLLFTSASLSTRPQSIYRLPLLNRIYSLYIFLFASIISPMVSVISIP